MAESNVPINDIAIELEKLRNEKKALEDKLKKKENMQKSFNKKYYENHKDEMIYKANERLKKIKETNPEKIKEYRRRAYLKSKMKSQESIPENI